MAHTEESRGNHLANTAANTAALKQSQSLMETPRLRTDAIGDLKDKIMEAHHLALRQKKFCFKWLEQGCKFDPQRNL